MKISEFAKKTNVTIKMLRHYDEIGLMKPSSVNKENRYRDYGEHQEKYINWIKILKHLDFSLAEIKDILDSSTRHDDLIRRLKGKRIEISIQLNAQISKKLQIDQLIEIIESEGFDMNKKIDLMQISKENVMEILKKIPNLENLLDAAGQMLADTKEELVCIMRMDIDHFKSVNDDFGHDVGDKVIAAIYDMFQSGVQMLSNQALIARAGGDELVALFFGNENRARQIAESIQLEVRNYNFAEIGCPRIMTCSFGILCHRVKGIDLPSVIDLSIEAVIKAKKNGRDAICVTPAAV